MRQKVENLKAFTLKLGLGLSELIKYVIHIVFFIITGYRRDSVHGNLLPSIVTGKPPESLIHGFMGF